MCDTLVASGVLGGFRSALVRCVGVWRQIDVVARGFRLGSWMRSADSARVAGRMTVLRCLMKEPQCSAFPLCKLALWQHLSDDVEALWSERGSSSCASAIGPDHGGLRRGGL